jgi:hypothetical protein
MAKTFQVLLVDQFAPCPTPYELSQRPMRFDDLVKRMMEMPPTRYIGGNPTQVLEVDDTYRPPMCSTVFRASEDGNVEVWKYRWDSSG